MKRTLLLLAAWAVASTPLAAQNPQRPRQTPEALRQRVVERFVDNFVQQAGLTAEQQAQFRAAIQRQFQQRRQAEQRRRQLLRAMEEQMRPGVAAEEDSVSALLASLVDLGEETAAALRAEQEGYAGFLSPVQRALLVIHYERFQRQIQAIRRRPAQPPRRGNGQRE